MVASSPFFLLMPPNSKLAPLFMLLPEKLLELVPRLMPPPPMLALDSFDFSFGFQVPFFSSKSMMTLNFLSIALNSFG